MNLRQELLADPGHAGLAQIPSDAEGWLSDARKAGLVVAKVDASACATKDSLLAAIAVALDFPDWFGANWDALRDCLIDLSWLPQDGYMVVLTGLDTLRKADPESLATALEIFTGASHIWREDGIPFWTLVDLAPDDLPGVADLA